jgi:DNA modification methylase
MRKRTADEMNRLAKTKSFSTSTEVYAGHKHNGCPTRELNAMRWPDSVIRITAVINNSKEKVKHPSQKPVALMRYLIETYTAEGEVVLDCFCGSGSTLVAAKQTCRQFIGCDSAAEYVALSRQRLALELPLGVKEENAKLCQPAGGEGVA